MSDRDEAIASMLRFEENMRLANEKFVEFSKEWEKARRRAARLRFSNRWSRLWSVWYCIKGAG